MIPYSRQNITTEDEEAVCKALHHPFLTQGQKLVNLKRFYAEQLAVKKQSLALVGVRHFNVLMQLAG